jgi:hypothetical protein
MAVHRSRSVIAQTRVYHQPGRTHATHPVGLNTKDAHGQASLNASDDDNGDDDEFEDAMLCNAG